MWTYSFRDIFAPKNIISQRTWNLQCWQCIRWSPTPLKHSWHRRVPTEVMATFPDYRKVNDRGPVGFDERRMRQSVGQSEPLLLCTIGCPSLPQTPLPSAQLPRQSHHSTLGTLHECVAGLKIKANCNQWTLKLNLVVDKRRCLNGNMKLFVTNKLRKFLCNLPKL